MTMPMTSVSVATVKARQDLGETGEKDENLERIMTSLQGKFYIPSLSHNLCKSYDCNRNLSHCDGVGFCCGF